MKKKRVRELATSIRMSEHRNISSMKQLEQVLWRDLDKRPNIFNMFTFHMRDKICNTVGCIGGFAIGMYGHDRQDGPVDATAGILGISYKLAEDLCLPGDGEFEGGYDNISTEQAAIAVENLLDERVQSGELHPWHHMGLEKDE